jgi:alginate O-acetyltransferase complex protein AlgJ
MSTAAQPLPAGGPSREEVAKIEIGITAIAPATAWLMFLTFVAMIFTVPAIELMAARDEAAPATWSHLTEIPAGIRTRLAELTAQAADATFWQRTLAVNRAILSGLQDFERGLEQESRLGQALRPTAQLVVTRWAGAGNERVYPGRNGWVFYRPDVEYVTGPGFLDAAHQKRRIASAPEWTAPPQPDPRPALRQFKRDLDARGIALVVVPTPVKPVVHPEKLAPRMTRTSEAIHNLSYASFIADLSREGLLVFDPTDILADGRLTTAKYLATDTHWRPEAIEAVVEGLAAFISARAPLPAVAEPGYRLERTEQRHPGDTSRMLDLPPGATLYPSELIYPTRVLLPDGSPWRPSRDADVLVLGDSFSNVFANAARDPDRAAGFVEHLSYALGRPVDRIIQEGDGAFATREMLQREPSRLAGKRLVIYQFATRELLDGDWKVIEIPSSPADRPRR